jgi:cob(I)alamin adenosyltransferase
LARIYTRTGDDGTTGRIGGSRVSKDTPYIEACGSLDELNALIGFILSYAMPDRIGTILQTVQDKLITIGAEIATPEGRDHRASQGLCDEDIRALEQEIDSFEHDLQPLKKFILPGGSIQASALHLVRAVARRAERRCVGLSRIEKVNPCVLRYLNRLSDLCFVMARYANLHKSIPESHPTFGSKRS